MRGGGGGVSLGVGLGGGDGGGGSEGKREGKRYCAGAVGVQRMNQWGREVLVRLRTGTARNEEQI